MRKIKIGLLIRNFDELTNTEFRIYEKLLNSKYCKIDVLIKDGRIKNKKKLTRFLKKILFLHCYLY